MADSIERAFDEYLTTLRSTKVEIGSAAAHRFSIKTKLEQDFNLTAFFRSGSFGNGTNVSGYSDVDYFAVIPAANLKADSAVTLSDIATALRYRFPTTPNIRVNGPAVQIPFGLDGAEHTEIIPVDGTGTTKLGFRQFDMPDGNGGWMFSSPESHNAYVREADTIHGGRVRRLVRLIKAWHWLRGVKVRSFYLELFVTRYAMAETIIIYDIDVRNILRLLSDQRLPSIIDPRFPNDGRIIQPCSTALLHSDALARTERAACWADEAVSARFQGQMSIAFNKWDLIFNYSFPQYTG
jgi:hypothetical protein